MISIDKKNNCCGCHACYSICPKGCITMEPDDEGFSYPKVEHFRCIKCKACIRVCPIINSTGLESDTEVYACYNKNFELRKDSSSGGIFSEIANNVLKSNGIVFGVKFDEEFNVKHDYVEGEKNIYKIRGSKYCESIIGENFKILKNILLSGKKVLFSGTPCQVAGLKKYLHEDFNNLICIDVACHGVPSQYVWNKYLKEISNSRKIKKINFRDKRLGWEDYCLSILYSSGDEFIQSKDENLYIQGFVNDIFLRPSCYKCKFKGFKSGSDITLADFWGVDNIIPDLNDKKGLSLAFINSKKGNKIFKDVQDNLIYKNINKEDAIKYNSSLSKSAYENGKRHIFFKFIKKLSFSQAMELSVKKSFIIRVKMYFKFKVHNLKL